MRRPGAGQGALSGPRAFEGDNVRPAEVAEHYGVPVDRAGPAYAELALLRGDPSDGLPGVPGSVRRRRPPCWANCTAGGIGCRQRPEIQDVHGVPEKAAAATDYIEAAGPVVRVARDAPVAMFDQFGLRAAQPPPIRAVAELAGALGVTSSIGRLQKALDQLPPLLRRPTS